METFAGKVVIITGSSSGIGAETAIQFAARGAKVVLVGRSEDGLKDTKSRCQESGASADQISTIPGDLTCKPDVTRVVEECIRQFGRIDILVNSAGESRPYASFQSTSEDDVIKLFDINTMSAFRMTQAAMPHLLESRGCVVNVSSFNGPNAVPSFYPSTLSKAALDQLTQSLALGDPSQIKTPIFRKSGLIPEGIAEEQFFQNVAKINPMKRVGQPSEVAAAVLFLASDQSSFTTGLLLPVDGGRTFCSEGVLRNVKT